MKLINKIPKLLSMEYYRVSLDNCKGLGVDDNVKFGDGNLYKVKVILKKDIIVKKINT